MLPSYKKPVLILLDTFVALPVAAMGSAMPEAVAVLLLAAVVVLLLAAVVAAVVMPGLVMMAVVALLLAAVVAASVVCIEADAVAAKAELRMLAESLASQHGWQCQRHDRRFPAYFHCQSAQP